MGGGTSLSSPICLSLFSSETPFAVFLFVSAFNSRSVPLCSLTGSDPQYLKVYRSLSQFLKCLVIPPFGLRLVATWISLGHERLWLCLEVLLMCAHRTGTSYLCPLDAFPQFHLISSASTWKHPYLLVKTLTRVGSASVLSGAVYTFDSNYYYKSQS